MSQFSFQRPALANQLCEALAGGGIIDARSGMFLAAPRRVGKSTFLREDLVPEILKRDWLPLYVDLWANKEANPDILIAEVIKSAIASFQGRITKAAKSVGLDKINLGGIEFDLNMAGLPENITMSDALEKLYDACKSPIVLIVDEAQHALKTPAGLNLMFALKAARDHLNRSNVEAKLMLVFTGSHRDKLAHLVLKKDQPFFGASVTPFPLLGRDFTNAFTDWANESLAVGNHLAPDAVYAAFRLVGHKPEMLRTLIGQIVLAGEANNLSNILNDKAQEIHDQMWYEMESDFNSLNPLQKAVLQVMIAKRGSSYPPFSEESISEYKRITGSRTITMPSIQNAIEALRDRGLIWNPSRGYYALEDEGLAEWYERTQLGQ